MGISSELYIGLMSGTSADAIDTVLVDFSESTPRLLNCLSTPLPKKICQLIHSLATPSHNEIDRMGELDQQLGLLFADSINQLVSLSGFNSEHIHAIGSHGQTIRHRPPLGIKYPFTLQIGDPNVIAHQTQITTVADFRRRDMAAHGQGAPLVPGFHKAIFQSDSNNRAIVNIGGMANITWLPKQGRVTGFDTGPGNVLMDMWILEHQNKRYDANGDWAKSGTVDTDLLAQLLTHPFFNLATPKSTGRETFNGDWLASEISSLSKNIQPVDIQSTLLMLTAITITDCIKQLSSESCEVFVCGGGAYNSYLMNQIASQLPNSSVHSTAKLGIAPEWVEAMAFAWLAQQTMNRKSGNLCAVTGAEKEVILGGVYFA